MIEIYNELPDSVKSDVGFPSNYMSLSREQQEFVDCFSYFISTRAEVNRSDALKDDLEVLIEDLENIISEL